MHVPFPLQCWDVIAKLRGYNNIAKGRGKTKGSRIFQSVSRFLSKIVVSLTVNWCKHTDFWYTSIFHLGLIEDDNKSHNFTNSHFCYVTLCYSIQSGLSWMNNHSIYSSSLIFINIFIDWFIIHTPDNVQNQHFKTSFYKNSTTNITIWKNQRISSSQSKSELHNTSPLN